MAACRSASRSRTAPVRSRSVISPSRRSRLPISSARSLSNATSSRSMSSSVVFAASSANGRLMRDESHPASSTVTSSVTSTATPNQRSTVRSQVMQPRQRRRHDQAGRHDPGAIRARLVDERQRQLAHRLVAGSRARAGSDGRDPSVSPGSTRVTVIALSLARRARNPESTAMPATTVKCRSPSGSESSRASATNGPSAVRAWTRARPFGAVGRRSGQPLLHPIELVAEMPRAHDAPRVVLDLQHVQPGQVHRGAGVIERVGALRGVALHHRQAQPVVGDGDRAQPRQPGRQQRSLSLQVLSDQIDQRRDPRLVGGGEPLTQRATHAESEHEEWHEHDGSGGEQNADRKVIEPRRKDSASAHTRRWHRHRPRAASFPVL